VEDKKGHEQIVITEIPYAVNKATMVEKIAELVKEKRSWALATCAMRATARCEGW
jgi:DNA gyrase/topoisomerase IV subunit A